MQREIFVGSSSESLSVAKGVEAILSRVAHVHTVVWPNIFSPGSVTFEALEAMLVRCCGAVFVASADDHGLIRGQDVKLPRANVMLEFGLVSGRMGRQNIALCQYGEVALPSDLSGMTVIPMDPPPNSADPDGFKRSAEQKLRVWASRLLATTVGIPRTEIFHGPSEPIATVTTDDVTLPRAIVEQVYAQLARLEVLERRDAMRLVRRIDRS